MTNIQHPAEDGNAYLTANNNKDTAATKSAFEQSIPGGSGDKKQGESYRKKHSAMGEALRADMQAFYRAKRIAAATKRNDSSNPWRFFSPALAQIVGISGAVVSYGIYTWIKTPRPAFAYNPTIDGKRACYRSTRQLAQEDYQGLWDDTSLLQIINRVEAKQVGLIVDRSQRKLHFAMNDQLLRLHENKDGFLGFKLDDALRYGVLEAVLLANVDFQVETFRNCVIDDAGRSFGELSPTKLTRMQKDNDGVLRKFLPCSRDAVSDALMNLQVQEAMVAHPTRTSFYRRVQADETVPKFARKASKMCEAKVSSGEAKISTREAEISRASEVLNRNTSGPSNLCQISETLDSNRDRNPDGKCVLGETASLRSSVSLLGFNLSPCAKKLMEFVSADLSALRQRSETSIPKSFHLSDHAVYEVVDDGIHDERCKLIGFDLIYDWLPVIVETGKPYSRKGEIDEIIKQLDIDFRCMGWKPKGKEMRAFRQIFEDHPLLDYDKFKGIVDHLPTQMDPTPCDDLRVKGHDWHYHQRRVNSLGSLLKRLRAVIKEMFVLDAGYDEFNPLALPGDNTNLPRDKAGKPMFDYSKMPEPFFSMAFAGHRQDPVTYRTEIIEEKTEIKDYGYEMAQASPARLKMYQPRYETVTRYERIPLYYDQIEGCGIQSVEVHLEKNPILAM